MSKDQTPEEVPAHDVLAAEEFALPAPDPAIGHPPVALPEDPTGIPQAHDVLAAEEFAMPAPRSSVANTAALARRARSRWWLAGPAAGVALLALRVRWRRRSVGAEREVV